MSKINNFNEFRINEADESPRSKEALITVFCETLSEILEETKMTWSYSTFAQSNSKNAHDPLADFNVIVAHFGRHGWTKKALDNFFAKYGKDVLKIYDNGNDPGEGLIPSAGADIFFYYMAKPSKDFYLMGYPIAGSVKEQGVGEFWIKFGYGYQNTKYGNLVIKQQFGDIKEWYKLAYDSLQKGLFGPDDSNAIDGNLGGTEWDTPKIKSLVKRGTSWDGGSTITIDLAPVEDNLGDERYAMFLNDFKGQLSTLGFEIMPEDKGYSKGGTGTVKRSVVKLTLKK